MRYIESKRRKVLDVLDRVLISMGFQPAIKYREDMVEYARQQAEDLCKELIKRGDFDTMPEISAYWSEACGGPVVNIELPTGYINATFEIKES